MCVIEYCTMTDLKNFYILHSAPRPHPLSVHFSLGVAHSCNYFIPPFFFFIHLLAHSQPTGERAAACGANSLV